MPHPFETTASSIEALLKRASLLVEREAKSRLSCSTATNGFACRKSLGCSFLGQQLLGGVVFKVFMIFFAFIFKNTNKGLETKCELPTADSRRGVEGIPPHLHPHPHPHPPRSHPGLREAIVEEKSLSSVCSRCGRSWMLSLRRPPHPSHRPLPEVERSQAKPGPPGGRLGGPRP